MTGAFFPVTTSDQVPAPRSGWRWCLLRDIARLESGHTPSRREPLYWDGGNVPWLSLKDIRGLAGRYVTATEDMPTQTGIDNSSARVLPRGTVAFCRTASVGKVAILGRDMATSQDFANWVCGPELLPEYLYEALRASGGQFDKEKQGTTHKTIYMPVLERFRVLVPPLAEQRRIADILDKADAIRRKRKEAIALTEELLRSAFLDMFGDPVTNPKGWPITTLGEEASQMKYGTSEKCGPESPGALPVLRIPNVVGGEISWTELKYATLDARETDRLRLSNGDLLFVRTNGNPDYIGRCAVYESNRAALFASYLIRVRLDGRQLCPTYVRAAFSANSYRSRLTAEARTTAGNYNISTDGLRRLQLPVPPMDAQMRFSNFETGMRRSFERLKVADADVEELFAGLVQHAFSGSLVAPC